MTVETSRKVTLDGTEYVIKPLGFGDVSEIVTSDAHELTQMADFAQRATFNTDGARTWPTLEAARAAPFPVVKACGQIAVEVSRVADTLEDLAGN